MPISIFSFRARIATILLLTSVTSVNVAAQTPRPGAGAEKGRRVPVTIALVDSYAYGDAPATILRRAATVPHDVIVMPRRQATGDRLSAAIVTLLTARELAGDTARRDATVRVASQTGPRQWLNHETRQNSAFIQRVLTSAPKMIPGVGLASAGNLYLLPHVFRGNLRSAGAAP